MSFGMFAAARGNGGGGGGAVSVIGSANYIVSQLVVAA